jgi:polyisoprenoid-binding protein YceI
MLYRAAFGAALLSLSSAVVAVGVTSTDPTEVPAGTYTLDPTHTSAAARVSHLGFTSTTVMFDTIEGTLTYDPADPESSTLNVTIDTNSLSSGFATRDEHLKGENWFNTAAYPSMTFTSDRLVQTGPTSAVVIGELTMRGVTKRVSLDVDFLGLGDNMRNRTTVGFSATTALKRSDFGLTSSIPAIGDEAVIQIDVEAVKDQ